MKKTLALLALTLASCAQTTHTYTTRGIINQIHHDKKETTLQLHNNYAITIRASAYDLRSIKKTYDIGDNVEITQPYIQTKNRRIYYVGEIDTLEKTIHTYPQYVHKLRK